MASSKIHEVNSSCHWIVESGISAAATTSRWKDPKTGCSLTTQDPKLSCSLTAQEPHPGHSVLPVHRHLHRLKDEWQTAQRLRPSPLEPPRPSHMLHVSWWVVRLHLRYCLARHWSKTAVVRERMAPHELLAPGVVDRNASQYKTSRKKGLWSM